METSMLAKLVLGAILTGFLVATSAILIVSVVTFAGAGHEPITAFNDTK
jgi:hypothetical protein